MRSELNDPRQYFRDRCNMLGAIHHHAASALTTREFLAAALGLTGVSPIFGAGQTPKVAPNMTQLQLGDATIAITFGDGSLDLPRESIIAWIAKAAKAVARYYGVFPVPFTRVRVNPSARQSGVFGGETWGRNPPFTQIFVGRNTTAAQLHDDWTMTHEFVHLAFPDVAEDHHWIEEGAATYVEPIARVQIGDLTPERIWTDMFRGMPKGEPELFDKGLDHTRTWGRTYWGGALFCLVADVRIRQATSNGKGLQDALRGIRDAGGTIENDWPVERAFEIGDRATHTNLLTRLYAEMKDRPVYVDLHTLWSELGVNSSDGVVSLDDTAPLAQIRQSITSGSPV
jgi:hypothetical protein